MSQGRSNNGALTSDLIQCAMNHRLYRDASEGIWDDGEWVSWEWINGHLEDQELKAQYPHASLELIEAFEALVDAAVQHYETTGRHLEIWRELGEVYTEVKHGLKRNRQHAPGSDGRIGNDHCEVNCSMASRFSTVRRDFVVLVVATRR